MNVHRGRAFAYVVLALAFGALSYAVGVGSLLGQRAEASVLDASRFTYTPPAPLGLVSVPAVAAALVLLGLIAWWAHGIARAVWVITIPMLGIVASQLLKQQLLERPALFELDVENSFPSGHMTVYAVLVGGLIWALPTVARPVVAVAGAALLGVVAWQLLEYGWHRPSDLIGALSLGVLVFALGALVRLRKPSVSGPRSGALAATNRVLSLLLTLAGLLLIVGGLLLAVAAGWFSSAALMLVGAQVALIGAGALATRAFLALAP